MGPSTNMAFTGTLTTGDGQFDRAPVTAYFTMWGSIIANGDLMLTVDGERATATIPFRSGGFAEGSLQIGKASATLVLYRP